MEPHELEAELTRRLDEWPVSAQRLLLDILERPNIERTRAIGMWRSEPITRTFGDHLAYDQASDVLYVTFVPGVPAVATEIEEGVLARIDPNTHELVGLTITGLSVRPAEQPVEVGVRGRLTMPPRPGLVGV